MAVMASILPLSFKFQACSLLSRPSIRTSHGGIGGFRPRTSHLKLSSSYSISSSGIRPILLQTKNAVVSSSQHHPLAIVAAKGYKMKTHKASAKRFRVTGSGKIMRRRAGKQHLLAKKNTKRKLRLSKMVQVNRSDYDNVIGCLPYLKWIAGNDSSRAATSQYNPLAEPSPLGLRLKKSPSLLELIQMRLSQGNTSTQGSKSIENSNPRDIVGNGTTAATCSNDKLKASNFPASLLRIGHWEYATKYEGDLVAKCYFAKHKLVWEILDRGLKSKIEIQWSDIMGLNAKFPEDGPATMTVVLARQPLFFRETNPQPRKHTLWQATADFTDGQASAHRQHFLQIPNGVLNKHFEKLIQCDMRLNFLSHQPEMVIDSPYFESLPLSLKDSKNNLQIHNVDQSLGTSISPSSNGSPSVSQSSSVITQQENYAKREYLSHETPSPSSGCVSSDTETQAGPKNWEQLVMQGLKPSMSMTDLVNHIGSCISGERITEEGSESHKILEDIAQHLLCDSQIATCSDEKSLMSRVNSLCCLLQKDGTPVQINANKGFEGSEDQKDTTEGDTVESSSFKPTMSRKDSYGDLLLSLPRITSLPKFLFDISEDGENQAR